MVTINIPVIFYIAQLVLVSVGLYLESWTLVLFLTTALGFAAQVLDLIRKIGENK